MTRALKTSDLPDGASRTLLFWNQEGLGLCARLPLVAFAQLLLQHSPVT